MPFSANATFNFRLSARLTFRLTLRCALIIIIPLPFIHTTKHAPTCFREKYASLAIASRFSIALASNEHTVPYYKTQEIDLAQ